MRAVLFVMLIGCGQPIVGPIPRFGLEPRVMCEGEVTRVRLDAGTSVARDGEISRYDWQLSPEGNVVQGGLDEKAVTVELSGEQPTQVRLTVWDDEGPAWRERTIDLVRSDARACATGCAATEQCVVVDGESLCVDADGCDTDGDCGCLRCVPADDGRTWCQP